MTIDTRADHHLVVNGLKLNYTETGSGPSALVLHGIMGHAREWDVLIDALAPHHRVVSLDQRGHGRSQWAPEYTATALADDIAGVIEALDLAPVHVIGHSMGAMAAQVLAARRPELVGRLVVIDIAPASVEDAGPMLAGWMEGLVARRYQDIDEAMAEWMTDNHLAQESHMRHYVENNLVADENGRLRWRFDPEIRQFVTGGVTSAELWEAIDRLTAPTLLVRGEHSPHLSLGASREVMDRLQNGTFVQIRDGAHDLGVEQPERVAEAVLDFLAGG